MASKQIITEYEAEDHSFQYFHALDFQPNPNSSHLHYETRYEIYIFLRGAGSFTVEGNKYELEPYSILIMNPNELHVARISEHLPYERMVLYVSESFLPPFLQRGVDLFRAIKFRKIGQNNQISPRLVKNVGLQELLIKLEEHLKLGTLEDELVAKCIIVQILSALNKVAAMSTSRSILSGDKKADALIKFINSHLDEPLTLDTLACRFFVTKYHLCRLFKESTGYSINQYITYKRIRLADAFMLNGHTPTEACFRSGFNNYSSFYKAYRKLTGKSPRSVKVK